MFLKILHWFILKYFKMCSLNQIIKSSVPASLPQAILSSSVSTSWTPPKKVWRSMWCSNDSTDHLGFMSIYVDLCGFMQFIWCCFSRNYAIYGDFFWICLPTNLLAELLMNVNGSTPKKWRYLVSYESQSLPINFVWSISYSKKNIMQFRTGKHHQAICDSFLWITLGEFREWKKHIPRNSQSHLADRGFRCHLPPGLLENPPCSDGFSHKKKCPVRGFSSRVWF